MNIQGIDNAITSVQFLKFENDYLPEKIVFMGGRYISFEFAHIAIRSGCKDITILHRGKQPLEHFDPALVKQLVQRSQEIGIDIRLQTAVKRIEFSDDGKSVVHYSSTFNTKEDNDIKKQ